MIISVVICTHNPRRDYLRRVLDALQAQTLPKEQWELLLIDNASKEPLAEKWDLSWHPHCRHIREEKPGKAYAFFTAIHEAKGKLMLIVDDDNVLAPDYLEKAVELEVEFPKLGVWGGQILPEFEITPPGWMERYYNIFALRTVEKDQWGSSSFDSSITPWGAGSCIRREVLVCYKEHIARNQIRLVGRKGKDLTTGEDVEIALVACESGYEIGVFARLRLTHIIPATRIRLSYLVRWTEGNAYSMAILVANHGSQPRLSLGIYSRNLRDQLCRLLLLRWRKFLIQSAEMRGHRRAMRELRSK